MILYLLIFNCFHLYVSIAFLYFFQFFEIKTEAVPANNNNNKSYLNSFCWFSEYLRVFFFLRTVCVCLFCSPFAFSWFNLFSIVRNVSIYLPIERICNRLFFPRSFARSICLCSFFRWYLFWNSNFSMFSIQSGIGLTIFFHFIHVPLVPSADYRFQSAKQTNWSLAVVINKSFLRIFNETKWVKQKGILLNLLVHATWFAIDSSNRNLDNWRYKKCRI